MQLFIKKYKKDLPLHILENVMFNLIFAYLLENNLFLVCCLDLLYDISLFDIRVSLNGQIPS